ncbi:hypothetical protein HGA88_04165 [Candidatus Roizmanbacteria bacterium]|nr:hypothetical protein [Candidatus Roizmanbacteria bacterium]
MPRTKKAQGDAKEQRPEPTIEKKGQRNVVGGLVLIAIGGIFLADRLFPYINFLSYWPIVLIVIGVGILLQPAQR